jgi:cell division protein FtsB
MGHNATREKNSLFGKAIVYAMLIFQVLIIISLVRGLQESYKSRERVELLEKKRILLVEENQKLQEDVSYVQSSYYIEKVAREELQRAKPGEQVVILPENQRVSETMPDLEERVDKELKNWEKWWELLVN